MKTRKPRRLAKPSLFDTRPASAKRKKAKKTAKLASRPKSKSTSRSLKKVASQAPKKKLLKKSAAKSRKAVASPKKRSSAKSPQRVPPKSLKRKQASLKRKDAIRTFHTKRLINVKVYPNERTLIRENAKRFAGGNMTLWLITAGRMYRPKKALPSRAVSK